MIKRLPNLLLALSLGSLSVVYAIEPHITVEGRNGEMTSLSRTDTDRINLNAETIEIISKSGEVFTVNKADIARILLSDNMTEVESNTLSGIIVTPLTTHDILEIRDVEESIPYRLFDLNGTQRLSGKCNVGTTSLSLSCLENGMYLLIVDRYSYKIIKR